MAGQSKRSVVLHDVWGELRVETRDSAGWFVPSLGSLYLIERGAYSGSEHPMSEFE